MCYECYLAPFYCVLVMPPQLVVAFYTINIVSKLCFDFFFSIFSTKISAQPYDPGTNTITRVINPGDKVDIPCSVVTPGGSVRWALNNKPIPLVSLLCICVCVCAINYRLNSMHFFSD